MSKVRQNLHSNMDRLKPASGMELASASDNLHSNMDRLKPYYITLKEICEWIYIPIWID